MKLIIEVTESYYEFIKNNTLKSVSDITILDGKPYEERPQGEWSDESKDSLLCSVCGKCVYKPFIGGFPTERTSNYYPNFCAFCGADMRGE